ncbi:MAG: hypothetical protein IK152_10030 [Lachnospiraceae bacterium]|nr:hypothetical protein [Lachnospiraceae bacterium]
MKITNSAIAMSSTHQEHSYTYREAMTLEAAKSDGALGAILTLSSRGEGKSVKEAMLEYKDQQEEMLEERRKQNEARSLQHMADQMKVQDNQYVPVNSELDYKIKMLRRMLAALRGEKYEDEEDTGPCLKGNTLDMRSAHFRQMSASSFSVSAESVMRIAAGTGGGSGTTWQKITAVSGFTSESESTSFAATGMAQTADGRSISFNVELSMSRAFMEEFDFLEATEYIKTDPLMINLDTDIGSVSDKKFYFDLDGDGRKENISFAGEGSGFLALDKNGDGKINDGTELFGTKSGDGFRDLSLYDEDKNGWIDENDSIFSKLKVWTKDEDGNDRLIDLKNADVGAIYLGNADTQFSLKDDSHRLNAEIKKTGIYLRESTGAVGTLNHVDLAV